MTESAASSTGRIFISYRREETAYAAGWLYDRLADRYGGGQVFKDVDSIQLGDDFVEVITAAVGSCDVLLALVGDQWLTITDEDGRRRLDDPDDFVRKCQTRAQPSRRRRRRHFPRRSHDRTPRCRNLPHRHRQEPSRRRTPASRPVPLRATAQRPRSSEAAKASKSVGFSGR